MGLSARKKGCSKPRPVFYCVLCRTWDRVSAARDHEAKSEHMRRAKTASEKKGADEHRREVREQIEQADQTPKRQKLLQMLASPVVAGGDDDPGL